MKKFFCAIILIFSFNSFAQKKISFDRIFPVSQHEIIIKVIIIINELIHLNSQPYFVKNDNLIFFYLIKLNFLIDSSIRSKKNIFLNDLIYVSKTLKNINNRYQKLNIQSSIINFLFNQINKKLELLTIHNLFLK